VQAAQPALLHCAPRQHPAAKDAVARASLPARLICSGGDDELSTVEGPVANGSRTGGRDKVAPHRSSPRIAADPAGLDR
jgi:hypothetical protein